MNKEEWKDYKKLSGEITEKLDNTSTYESWLIIQEYIDRCQQENKKYKEVIDKLKTNIENDIDGFRTINEFGESQAILELLDIYLGILKEVNK